MTINGINKKKPHLSLSVKTLIGLLIGLAVGLFFGELCSSLEIFGDAFVGLLQMAVLPYIAISLITSVGRLTPQQATRLAGGTGLVLLILWFICLSFVIFMASAFPPHHATGFYSNTLLETPASLNFLELFIPTNPIRSFANNWIPAVVIFCVGLGLAVMAMPDKESFLTRLDDWLDILKRLNGYVVRLTPYGVFAIVAAMAGTMTIEELARIQAYLLSYTTAAIVLAFFLLPGLVVSCTPFRYREILDVTLQAMITAFATAKLMVVLPLLIEKTNALFEKHGYRSAEVHSDIEAIYPLMYPIPNLGKLLTLLFVPFAAWFTGDALELTDYPRLLGIGSLTYFGKPIIAMPLLLDTFQLPSDMFQLFIVADVYCSRIGDVLGVMHLFTLTVLGTCIAQGQFKLRIPQFAWKLGTSLLVAVILFIGMREWLVKSTSVGPSKSAVIAQMQLLRHPSPAVLHDPIPKLKDANESRSRLDIIRATGVIRVGYLKDHLPYSYLNENGELVGIDVDMAHMLAEELQCDLEFVPFEYTRLAHQLEDDHFDVAMSGLPITTSNLLNLRYSKPYLDVSFSFVVADYRRRQFNTVSSIQNLENFTVAMPPDGYFHGRVKKIFPNAEFKIIGNVREFFEGDKGKFDALLIDAESGSSWTILYPEFRTIVPQGLYIQQPLGFAVTRKDRELADFLSQWIELKIKSGELRELYEYWILGQVESLHQPRWSILRNILGIEVD